MRQKKPVLLIIWRIELQINFKKGSRKNVQIILCGTDIGRSHTSSVTAQGEAQRGKPIYTVYNIHIHNACAAGHMTKE